MSVADIVHQRGSLLVDENELHKFVSWLPDINWDECYLVFMIPRTRKFKEMFGTSIKETVIERLVVPGYVDSWRDKFIRHVRKLGILGYYSSELYTMRKHGYDISVPWEVLGILVCLNACNWVKASLDTVEDYISIVRRVYSSPEAFSREMKRIDMMFYSNLHSTCRGRFHLIDLDTRDEGTVSIVEEVLEMVFSRVPPKITTPHGYHYIIDTQAMPVELRAQWFAKGGIRDMLVDRFRNVLEYKDSVVQSPVPGTVYQGSHIVRFLY